jgi:peptidyl-prolyl cis-trans isomerase B (cyclophilin B)
MLSAIAVYVAFGALSLDPPSASANLPSDSGQAAGASEYDNLEAVLDTSLGQIVIEFLTKEAPRHVEYFVKQARSGAYDGTTFHRLVKYALIQGGDPLSKNPRDRARYGTGGLNVGLPDEVNKNKHVAGAVSSVLQAVSAASADVKPGTSGAQFFIVLNASTAQANLDRTFTVFGRVVEGMDVATQISTSPASAAGVAAERIEVKKVTIREKTPTPEQMKTMHATIETSLGIIELQLLPESAPNTARAFVRYARAGLYDGTTFFRVSQNYFMEVGYLGDWPQDSPNRKRIFSTWPIAAEKSDVKQERGTVSMRQNPDGTTSWYFFIISKDNPALDGKHVPFAKVVEGLKVLDKIADAEVESDKPKQRIEVKKISVQ